MTRMKKMCALLSGRLTRLRVCGDVRKSSALKEIEMTGTKKYAVKKIGIIERYQEYLPVTENTPIISLNEGNTPLILAEALPKELGLKNIRIYYKFEGLNPTGSFKDRG